MDNTLDIQYMRAALDQAKMAAADGEIPIGAVVVCNDHIIATGHNMTKRLSDPTAHAEMIALTAACSAVGGKYLTDCTIYVTVEPCPMCAAALSWAQIGRIVYGAPDPKRGYSLYRLANSASEAGAPKTLLHPRTAVTGGVLEEDCSEIVRSFFSSRR